MSIRQPAGVSIHGRVAAFGIRTHAIDGNDIRQVYQTAAAAVAEMRQNPGPVFLECATYRWLEHVGPHFDHDLKRTYRTQAEVEQWMAQCPVIRSSGALLADGWATAEELAAWEEEIQAQIDRDIERAFGDPWPDPKNLHDNIY